MDPSIQFSTPPSAFVSVSVSTLPFLSNRPSPALTHHTTFLSRRAQNPLCHSRSRARWYAISGIPPPPPPPPSDDNENISSSNDDIINRSDDGSRDAEFNLDLTTTKDSASAEKENNELYKFIQSVPPPELVKRFTESAPPVVQKAIRETLVSILGSLPPLAFYTTVSSMTANLVQLFHSTLITGYMFRNAAYRLELKRTLDWAGLNEITTNNKALPSSGVPTISDPEIKGGVASFKQADGSTIEVPIEEYIGELKKTVSNLKDELTKERKGGNELLSFVSTMDKDNLEDLTKNAGPEVVEAMKKVVDFVTVSQGIDQKSNSAIEASAAELGQLLFYLMVSGFFLREAEVRLDLQRQLGGENSLNNLLEGGSSSGEVSGTNEPDTDDGDSSSSPSLEPQS